MKTRAISLFLCAVIIIGVLAAGACAADGMKNFTKQNDFSEDTFTDVNPGDWFYDNVRSAYELGLMVGNSETTFNPKGDLTIAEAITVASRLHSIYHTGGYRFVQDMPWYRTFVDYAEENGIISGEYPDYNKTATRAEYASILANALPAEALPEINEVSDNAIPDVKADDTYADAVYSLYRAGILNGKDSKGTFDPESSIMRCEVAAIISRMADAALRKNVELKSNEYGSDRNDAIASVLREKCKSKDPDGLLHVISWRVLAADVSCSAPVVGSAEIGTETVYLLVYHSVFGMSEGPEEISGSLFPAAITFLTENGEYSLKDCWTPEEGTDYWSAVRERFPASAADEALSPGKYADALKAENLAKATEYLNTL